MRTLLVATAVAGLLALSGVARAAQIASPTVYGTADQVLAENPGKSACQTLQQRRDLIGDSNGFDHE